MPSPFPRGVFTLSLDFELVWGSRDLYDERGPGGLEPLLQSARVTRARVFPALLELLRSRGMVATWATVGSLFLDRADPVGGALHPDVVPPRHAWRSRPWFDGVPAGAEEEHPEFYARSLVLQLRDAGQEIGSHSFSHPVFGDPGCSRQAADTELARCVAEARKIGITLRSFVFPRNSVGHVDLLARHGFACWRGPEPAWYYRSRVPRPLSRLGHLLDAAAARRPATVLPFRDEHGLWCIPGSASILPYDGVRRLIPLSQRVARCTRGLDQAAADRRICHLWFHPINLASAPDAMLSALAQVIDHAARLRDAGRLDVLPMVQVAERAAAAAA